MTSIRLGGEATRCLAKTSASTHVAKSQETLDPSSLPNKQQPTTAQLKENQIKDCTKKFKKPNLQCRSPASPRNHGPFSRKNNDSLDAVLVEPEKTL